MATASYGSRSRSSGGVQNRALLLLAVALHCGGASPDTTTAAAATTAAMLCGDCLSSVVVVDNATSGPLAATAAALPPPAEHESLAMQLAVPVTFAVIFVASLVGNSSVIYIVLRHRKMRSAPNIFIANLSVGDLLLMLLSVPMAIGVFVLSSWPFGEFVCKLSYFMKTLTVGVSVFTLTALSADRMVAIAFSMSAYHGGSGGGGSGGCDSRRRIIAILSCIWVASFALALPDAVSYYVETYPDGSRVCQPYPKSWEAFHYHKINVLQHFLLYYAIPLVVISVCYGVTARVMMSSATSVPGEQRAVSRAARAAADKQMRARRKVANMVIALVVLFFVCWLPRRIYLLWYNLSTDELTMGWVYFRIVGYCFSFCAACVNPIALYFVSKQFRKHYRRDILCRFAAVRDASRDASGVGLSCGGGGGGGGKMSHGVSCRSDSHAPASVVHTLLTETPNGSVMSVHSANNVVACDTKGTPSRPTIV